MNLKTLIGPRTPSILAVLGVVGFITATVMVAKVAPQVKYDLDVEEGYSGPLPLRDKIKIVAPKYAPAVAMMMISTAAIVASSHIHSARYASVLALYAVSERTLSRWQDAILEEVGPKKKELIRQRTTEPRGDIPQHITADGDRMLFFDDFTGRYFRADSLESVRRVVNEANDFMLGEDYITFNEYSERLGMPRSGVGEDLYWIASDGLIKVLYDSHIKDDSYPCVSMQFETAPKPYNAH